MASLDHKDKTYNYHDRVSAAITNRWLIGYPHTKVNALGMQQSKGLSLTNFSLRDRTS